MKWVNQRLQHFNVLLTTFQFTSPSDNVGSQKVLGSNSPGNFCRICKIELRYYLYLYNGEKGYVSKGEDVQRWSIAGPVIQSLWWHWGGGGGGGGVTWSYSGLLGTIQ